MKRLLPTLAGLAGGLAAPVLAGSLSYCQATPEPDPALQDRLIQVAGIVKQTLDASGQPMALIARSGLALQRVGQRYSHAGVSLRDSPNAPWSVRQLYYACDAGKPRIFDQGISGFLLGMHDPSQAYLSIVLLPTEAADSLARAALDPRLVGQLLGADYSANAYAFSTRYQNCNQWLAELLAAAWGGLEPGSDSNANNDTNSAPRTRAQAWLQAQGYAPSALHVGWQPLMWLARLLPWLHSDDHPASDLDAAQFRVSMPQSLEAFVRQRWPQAQRLEFCTTQQHLVLHRGWEPLAEGCEAGADDTVIALQSGPV